MSIADNISVYQNWGPDGYRFERHPQITLRILDPKALRRHLLAEFSCVPGGTVNTVQVSSDGTQVSTVFVYHEAWGMVDVGPYGGQICSELDARTRILEEVKWPHPYPDWCYHKMTS